MKKILIALTILASFSFGSEKEFGLGPLFYLDNGSNNIDVTIKYKELKFDVGGNFIGIDKLFIQNELSGDFGWFLGLGGYTDFDFNNIGLRLPLGLSYDISSNFDIFLQGVFSYAITPSTGSNGVTTSLGLRYFF